MESLPSETICEILLRLTAMESRVMNLVSKKINSLVQETNKRNWTDFYKLAGGSIVKNCMVYNLQYNEEYYNPWASKSNFYQLCDDLFSYNDSSNVIVIRSMEDELLKWDMKKPSRIISCDFTTGNYYFPARLILHIQSGKKTIVYDYYYGSGHIEKVGHVKGRISKNTIHRNRMNNIRLKKNQLERLGESEPEIIAEEVENASYFNGEIYFMKKGIIYSVIKEVQNAIKY